MPMSALARNSDVVDHTRHPTGALSQRSRKNVLYSLARPILHQPGKLQLDVKHYCERGPEAHGRYRLKR